MKNLEVLMKNLPEGVEAALVTHSVNRRYYTGFASSAGTLVVTPEKSYFIIDSRYYELANKVIQGVEVILQGKVYEQIEALLHKHDVKTVAIESDTMSLTEFAKLTGELKDFEISKSPALSNAISKQREIKNDWELENIQAAQDNTDKTFAHILNFIKAGKTEQEVALEMEFFSRQQGSEEPAFSFIVASGANSSMPHAVPSNNALKKGDFLTMDFGSTIHGYRSDMTRTVAIGEVSDKQREVYELVLNAHLASMAGVKAGVVCGDIDAIARDMIDATPYKGLFGHGLGHSLGLDVHENPRFSHGSTDIAQVGHVMSIEPGVYIPEEFGVRIEDIIAVTQAGYRNFATSPKELIIL